MKVSISVRVLVLVWSVALIGGVFVIRLATASIIENDEEMGKLRNIPDEQLMEMAAAVIPSKLTTELVPCYRRESHKEVYAGSHEYPGDGTYLLKFDNCFSMWRSKTLYYRIFYTR